MIFCFSGTGNSRYVAWSLASNLNDNVVELSGEMLTAPETASFDLATHKRVVWIFPIYSWGVPPIVVDFIKSVTLRGSDRCRHFMVCTCGDDIGNAHRQWRQLMRRRGWSDIATYSVTMPNTYTLMKSFDVDSKEIEAKKLNDAPERISEIARKITNSDNCDDVTRGSWAWVKSAIIYPYFKRYCMSPRPFHATDKCIGCGKCASSCPMNNVTMKDKHPQWGDKCALCLRCYHICPTHVVAYGKATKTKGQYLCPYSTLSHINLQSSDEALGGRS